MAERVHEAEQKQTFAEKEAENAKMHESELNKRIQNLEVWVGDWGEL